MRRDLSPWINIVAERGDDEWIGWCNAALEEIQAEVLRRAVRRMKDFVYQGLWSDFYDPDGVGQMLIDLIDPDKDNG